MGGLAQAPVRLKKGAWIGPVCAGGNGCDARRPPGRCFLPLALRWLTPAAAVARRRLARADRARPAVAHPAVVPPAVLPPVVPLPAPARPVVAQRSNALRASLGATRGATIP